MTHITDTRAIGNHAGTTRGTEMASAESVWDSEGGAAERVTADGEGGLAPGGAVGSPQTPTHLVH
jgi:hypothetical protein